VRFPEVTVHIAEPGFELALDDAGLAAASRQAA